MSEEKFIAVCASRDSANVGVFTVTRDDTNSIQKIKVDQFFTTPKFGKISNAVTYINKIIKDVSPKICLMDYHGYGIAYHDELHKQNSEISIVRMNDICFTQYRAKLFLLFNSYIGSDVVNIDEYLDKNKQQMFYEYYVGKTPDDMRKMVEGGFKEELYRYRDLVCMVTNLDISECNLTYQKRKDKVESNLTEIIQIFMDTLKESDIKDKSKVDSLIHMIDKANYMRGQY